MARVWLRIHGFWWRGFPLTVNVCAGHVWLGEGEVVWEGALEGGGGEVKHRAQLRCDLYHVLPFNRRGVEVCRVRGCLCHDLVDLCPGSLDPLLLLLVGEVHDGVAACFAAVTWG